MLKSDEVYEPLPKVHANSKFRNKTYMCIRIGIKI